MKTPLILTTRAAFDFEGKRRLGINQAYADAIENCGGSLVMLTSDISDHDSDDLLGRIDGLLIPGGTDVNPALYKETKKEYTQEADDRRDAMESLLLKKALAKKLPVLAICRGIQILNVELGGTLYQDVQSEMEGSLAHDRHGDGPRSLIAHSIALKEDSLLCKIAGTNQIEVNSLHHQGLKDLGKGLVSTGRAPDGLVEAVELANYPWLIGVQWHPEELPDSSLYKNLFGAFVQACSK